MGARILRITATAEADLAEIWAYIAKDAPERASAFIHQITDRFTPLLDHPKLGPSRDALTPGLRVQFHKSYAIYYRFTDDEVIILRVLHGARDAVALFKEEEG